MSDSKAIFWEACLAEVNDRIRKQVLLNRFNSNFIWDHKEFVMGLVDKLLITLMSTFVKNLTAELYIWTCTIWMPSFAVSQKWMGNSEQVFINQLNLRPTSIGKHNSTGHLLPCAIDFKTNHPPIHLQWIGKLGIATEQSHVISMGPHQPEVPGEAIVCSDIKRVKDSVKVWLVLKDMTGIIS